MKALGKGSIASIIKVILHVVGVILWIALVCVAVAAIAYAVAVGLMLSGTIALNLPGDGPWDQMVWHIVGPALFVGAFYIGGAILIVRRLLKLFESFTSGEPFKRENAGHLRVIWITMLVMEISRYVFGAIVLTLIVTFGLPNDGEANVSGEGFDLMPWLSILVLIVLAEVFREGARLREEQELTI